MEKYKEALNRLKEKATNYSIEDSEDCGRKYRGKNKSRHTNCSKEAAIPLHVFYEGKRQLKAIKKQNLEKCKKQVAPIAIQGCRNYVYSNLLPHLTSLEQWIEREKKKFNIESFQNIRDT